MHLVSFTLVLWGITVLIISVGIYYYFGPPLPQISKQPPIERIVKKDICGTDEIYSTKKADENGT